MSAASDSGRPGGGRGGESVRELLLGMGGSSMRKSYYPELRRKLDDLELFRELVERSFDAILLFELPSSGLIFANIAAREAFGIDERGPGGLSLADILGDAAAAGYPACLDANPAQPEGGCPSFIQRGRGTGDRRRFEVRINEVEIGDRGYAVAVARDLTERLLMEEKVRRDLVEKETMLREIHHRVKNNFQLMKSILSLEAASIQDERARIPLIESECRIMSMAEVHERLYESPDLSSVEAAPYFEDVASAARMAFREILPEADFEFSCEELFLPLELALPCGLIENELLSNSLKHAFPDGRPGGSAPPGARATVSISIGRVPGATSAWRMLVADNGVGFEPPPPERAPRTVGLTLIRTLVDQIGGSISWRGEGGAAATLEFPLPPGSAEPPPRPGAEAAP